MDNLLFLPVLVRGGWDVSDCHTTAVSAEYFYSPIPSQIFCGLGWPTHQNFGQRTRLGMLGDNFLQPILTSFDNRYM